MVNLEANLDDFLVQIYKLLSDYKVEKNENLVWTPSPHKKQNTVPMTMFRSKLDSIVPEALSMSNRAWAKNKQRKHTRLR